MTAALLVVVIAVVAFGSLRFKLYLGQETAQVADAVVNVVPQAWAFFTKDPRESYYVPYVEGADGWVEAGRGANAVPGAVFGWDRSPRLTEYDVQLALQDARETAWHDCELGETPGQCADAAIRLGGVDTVTVVADATELCGRVAVVRRGLVPMAYSLQNYEPPSEVIVRDVTCRTIAEGGDA